MIKSLSYLSRETLQAFSLRSETSQASQLCLLLCEHCARGKLANAIRQEKLGMLRLGNEEVKLYLYEVNGVPESQIINSKTNSANELRGVVV